MTHADDDRSAASRKSPHLNTYDHTAARERILLVATEEFASHGVADAGVDKIAKSAGVSESIVCSYFGSRDELYLAVLERAYAVICDAEAAIDLDYDAPVEDSATGHRQHF
ncbi:TetR/AcrR family transcriptional regulator [Caballeronia sp. ATUFL_M1_KS5A]|uniref:TetR/AcrR family transcriptional regulator n=1 Tax=Caballeronia sp. ATUFL_M1_KS5A TaxID=2921778 RepID=UPI0032EF5C3E